MAAIPGSDDAVIVLNVLSDDATLLRAGAGGLETPQTIRGVAHGANALTVSGDGGWAISWTDARRIKNADPFEAIRSHDHQARQAGAGKTIVSAGSARLRRFRRRRQQGLCRDEDGITVIDLAARRGRGSAERDHHRRCDRGRRHARRMLTPNGSLAVIRREGNPDRIVDLATSAVDDHARGRSRIWT
jgi:hypothetical protein